MIDETKIMQYADGTLPEEEKATVKKAIENDPQLQKLLKDYQETGEILFNLGKEIKSQPLPSSLQDKLKTINEEKSKDTKKPFIFFRIPKIAYGGIAAVFALIFYSFFSTQAPLVVEKNDRTLNLVAFENIDRPKFMDSTESTSDTPVSVDHLMLDINKIKNSYNDYISHYKVEKFLEEKISKEGIANKFGTFVKAAFRGGDAKTIYKNWHKSVFYIANTSTINEEESGEVWMGSMGTGSLIERTGLIITNWHVVDGAKQVWIYPFPKDSSKGLDAVLYEKDKLIGRVVAQSKKTDLALVKVTGLSSGIKVITLGDVKDSVPGEKVFAIGHPHGRYSWSITDGIINQIRPSFEWDYDKKDQDSDEKDHKATLIQNNAEISGGNSGGPLFNEQGKMIGINTWSEGGGQNLNFAVAVNHVKQLVQNQEQSGIKVETSINPLTVEKLKSTYLNIQPGDKDKNGKYDHYWVDTDNKKVGPVGPADTLFIDKDEDNLIEAILVDINENEIFEELLYDDDLDGTPEYKKIDRDEDGNWDAEAFDKDQDGQWDIIQELKT